jgi:hypothetical protein
VIEISRALAYRFRAVLRRSLMNDNARAPLPIVQCRANDAGLTLEARHGEVAVRYQVDGAYPADTIAFRGALLNEMEGRTDTPVVLELIESAKGQARWTERGVPRVVEFEPVAADAVPEFPALPDKLWPQSVTFLRALADAAATAAKESDRYATARIQLRGRTGEIVATDGRQMLLQGGFTLPWSDDVLIPARSIFGARDLLDEGSIEMGRTRTDLTLRVGACTLVLRLDLDGRFPNAEAVVPKLGAVKSRLRFDSADAAYLADALPNLPGFEDEHAPVTLQLGERVTVQAWPAAGGPAVQVLLARSSLKGAATRVSTDRQYLRRALRLGFTELQLTKADAAVCCRDRSRCYLWVPLDPATAMPADADVQRITAADVTAAPDTPTPPRRTLPMPTSSANGDAANGANHRDRNPPAEAPPPGGLAEVILEAEALRDALHGALTRTTRLLSALKLQKRQTRAVQQAVASLNQLRLDR